MSHASVISTMAERLTELGDIAADRVRSTQAPGTASVDDLVFTNDHTKPLCELIDHTLVEKAMGFEASVVVMRIGRILGAFVDS